MKLYPAIDLRGGKVVRLTQGDYDRMTVYDKTPIEVAQAYEKAGASCLHLVDLDGAKDEGGPNFETIKEILRSTSLFAEVGGGIRSFERIEAYLNAGAGRVILGTAALEDPAFRKEAVRRYESKIAVGVDAKDGKVATHGWLTVSETDSFEFCKTLAEEGVDSVIYTDIACDGAMKGTNLPAYKKLRTIQNLHIIASGGICTESDVKALAEMQIDGAIIGKALFTGALDLKELLCYEGGQN